MRAIGAKAGTRTRTGVTRQNLNLVRLPIPPLSQSRDSTGHAFRASNEKRPARAGRLGVVGCEGFEPSTY